MPEAALKRLLDGWVLSRNAAGDTIAALSVAGPADRMDNLQEQIAEVVRTLVLSTSRRLGYNGRPTQPNHGYPALLSGIAAHHRCVMVLLCGHHQTTA